MFQSTKHRSKNICLRLGEPPHPSTRFNGVKIVLLLIGRLGGEVVSPGLGDPVREVDVFLTLVPRHRPVQVPQHRDVAAVVRGAPVVHEELCQEKKPGCVLVSLQCSKIKHDGQAIIYNCVQGTGRVKYNLTQHAYCLFSCRDNSMLICFPLLPSDCDLASRSRLSKGV